jgi:hypothetical protein
MYALFSAMPLFFSVLPAALPAIAPFHPLMLLFFL